MVPGVPGAVSLRFCGHAIRVAEPFWDLISQRENVAAFRGEPAVVEGESGLALVGGDAGKCGWIDFDPTSGATGAYRLTPSGLETRSDTNALGLSLALRGLFSLAIERRGGVLVHASCVAWDGRAALITGVSGAGKSTLARWSTRAGATLLSDEIVGVLPDGTVLGTPFRSDPDLLGTQTTARLALVATLRHAADESFEPLPPHRLVEALCEQTFHRAGAPTARQVLACLGPAVEGVQTGRFSCRSALSAGEALRALLSDHPGPAART